MLCRALFDLLGRIPNEVISKVERVAFDGTSATTILLDSSSGAILADAKLYNEAQDDAVVQAAAVRSRNSFSAIDCASVDSRRVAVHAQLP